MLPTELPVEIWLLILRSLSTRDLVFLSLTCKLLKAIAENERMRRQDINRLFSKVVNNVDRFRHLMRTTGSLIIGDFATTFFTGAEVLDTVEIFFDNVHLEFCLKSWFSFLREESLVSGGTLSVCSYVAAYHALNNSTSITYSSGQTSICLLSNFRYVTPQFRSPTISGAPVAISVLNSENHNRHQTPSNRSAVRSHSLMGYLIAKLSGAVAFY